MVSRPNSALNRSHLGRLLVAACLLVVGGVLSGVWFLAAVAIFVGMVSTEFFLRVRRSRRFVQNGLSGPGR